MNPSHCVKGLLPPCIDAEIVGGVDDLPMLSGGRFQLVHDPVLSRIPTWRHPFVKKIRVGSAGVKEALFGSFLEVPEEEPLPIGEDLLRRNAFVVQPY